MLSAGLLLAITSSCAWAVLDGVRKHVGDTTDAVLATALLVLGQGLGLALALAWQRPEVPPLPAQFWAATAGAVLVNVFANVLYVRALQLSPLSLTVPYLAFTPVILLFTAWALLGELPGPRGVAGVVAVAFGAYLLHRSGSGARPKGAGGLAPPRTPSGRSGGRGFEKGSAIMLGVAVLWGFSASLDKVALQHAKPPLYGAIVSLGVGTPIFVWTLATRKPFAPAARKAGWFLAGGAIGTFALWAQYASLETLFVSYTIAIKRAGMLLAILIGHFVFREADLGKRLLGASVMLAGVLLLVIP